MVGWRTAAAAAGADTGGGRALHRVEAFVAEAQAQLHELVQWLSAVSFQVMLVVHALLILSACWLALARHWWSTAAAWLGVIGFGLAWLGVNGRWEGRVVYPVTAEHGLTEADLMVPVVIAAALLIRGLRYLGRAWLRRRQERISAGVPSVFRTMWPKF